MVGTNNCTTSSTISSVIASSIRERILLRSPKPELRCLRSRRRDGFRTLLSFLFLPFLAVQKPEHVILSVAPAERVRSEGPAFWGRRRLRPRRLRQSRSRRGRSRRLPQKEIGRAHV